MRYALIVLIGCLSVSGLALPNKFKQQGNDLVFGSNLFRISQSLAGRGQKGLANFYSDGRNEYLIKEDDPGTCLLEGSAQLVRRAEVLPKALDAAVNYAEAGFIETPSKNIVVSIQERVKTDIPGAQVISWDTLVYGQKRDPKTLASFESKYSKEIKDNVAGLSPFARWKLAAAILASAVAGDESLHVGQYMAAVDVHKNVLDIMRIDLGARERFAAARRKNNQQSAYNASSYYQKSGQSGKDYVSYLLAEPSLRQAYDMLWYNLGAGDRRKKVDRLKDVSQSVFLEQYNNLPDEARVKALSEVKEIVFKGYNSKEIPEPVGGQKLETFLANYLATIDGTRFAEMITEGSKRVEEKEASLRQSIENLATQKESKFLLEIVDLSKKVMSGSDRAIIEEARVKSKLLQGEILNWSDQAHKSPKSVAIFEKLELYANVGMFLADALYLSSGFQDSDQEAIRVFQSIKEVASFCVNAKKPEPKQAGALIMQGLLGGRSELNFTLIDKSKITAFTTDKGLVRSTPNKDGEAIIKRIRSRFLLPSK